jgi:hypothetical protein
MPPAAPDRRGQRMTWIAATLITAASFGQTTRSADRYWTFDPNTLQLMGPNVDARIRPVGEMHGIVINRLSTGPAPMDPGRALLNLEHYLAKGRCGENVPRHLEHTVTMNRHRVEIEFPATREWPVLTKLTYTFNQPATINARLDFYFRGRIPGFEAYLTSCIRPPYLRMVMIDREWKVPEINSREQLLIPANDAAAARAQDGRWAFLGDRVHVSDERFTVPIIISRDDDSGWSIVQMVEPGKCSFIAPNRFAHGHNFVLGGWDAEPRQRKTVHVRMLLGRDFTDVRLEAAYQDFTFDCEAAGPHRRTLP